MIPAARFQPMMGPRMAIVHAPLHTELARVMYDINVPFIDAPYKEIHALVPYYKIVHIIINESYYYYFCYIGLLGTSSGERVAKKDKNGGGCPIYHAHKFFRLYFVRYRTTVCFH